MKNLSRMVKPGGVVIHILPAAGYVDYGFYSYSPGFFHDFYSGNGFDLINLDFEFMISEGKWSTKDYEKKLSVYSPDLRMFDSSPENWGRADLNGLIHTICKADEVGHVYIWAVARKEMTKEIQYPLQGMYQCIKKATAEIDENAVSQIFDFEKICEFFEVHHRGKIGMIPAGGDYDEAVKHLFQRDLEDRIYRVFDNSLSKSGMKARGGFDIAYPT